MAAIHEIGQCIETKEQWMDQGKGVGQVLRDTVTLFGNALKNLLGYGITQKALEQALQSETPILDKAI